LSPPKGGFFYNLQSICRQINCRLLFKSGKRKRDVFKPGIPIFIQGGTVFVIGFIVTIISSLALRRNETAAA